ncbi:hypothetical protein BD779DRAFT_1432214 [Infundibulicybe gibba]|nr:hypothetical protein BD779DRAFT_1432214 [Infundibulicybe gibba]
MAKITNVLKTLGEVTVTGTSTYPGQPGNSSLNIHQPPPPLGQIPVASEAILGIPRREDNGSGPRHRRTLDMSPPATVADPGANQDHAYILANKWLSTNKLAHLVETQGLVYKKGKFSAIEEQQLKAAVDNYCIEKQLNPDQLNEVIFSKDGKNRDNAFWSEITAAIPQRPIIAVYHHVRRAYHQLGQKGKWGAEEDALLAQAVADLGQQWEKVSGRVGRMSSDCRDRYRNHLLNRDLRIIGAWTKQEEEELAQIMKEVMVDRGKDTDTDIFWGVVSQKMGGKRSRQQCRIKWTDALSKTIKNDGQTPRWGQQDAFILVHKIDSLNVRDDTEIDWQTLPDAHWNLWSAHTLQRRWLTMKRGIKGYEDMTHQEIMDILRVKKAQLPEAPTAPRKRKERKVKSAAAIADSDLQHDAATSPADGGAIDPSHNRPTNESESSESEES